MVKVNEIHSTATFAWSTDSIPVLATGTAAGVIDDSFSSSSSLDFYSLYDKEPSVSLTADAKFHDLDWSKDNTLLAGAMENNTIEFWNTSNLASKEVKSVAKGEKHTGAVKSLQFNPIQHNVLASGGANGEIFIWDTKKLAQLSPFAPGTAMSPKDSVVHSVSWNNSVPHIFASAGTAGYASIWDLKAKKEVLQLTYTSQGGNRAILSTVAWHPTQSTKVLTASESDGEPVILTWDLRNSNVPESILTGHKKGILSVDWNTRDSSLLLSSGKDNTTILWNPLTSEKLAQYPTTSNWAFKTKFAPSTPDYFATASFDKKIVIQSLQDTSPPVPNRINSTSEIDFWNKIGDTDTQQPEFFVKQAPNWYGRPSSVSFAFGGKIVKLSKTGEKSSMITIEKAQLPGSVENENLKLALESKDFTKIIESRIKDSFEGINKSDWELLDSLKDESNVFDRFIALNIKDDKAVPATADSEDFFNNLNDKPKTFTPVGPFRLEEDELTDALLTKNLSKAVDISLKSDKLVEALVIALNGSEELKQQVLNHYLNQKGDNDATARLLFSVSTNNVQDLVENADVSSWREIGNAIKTYSSDDEEVYRNYFNRLGDRVLVADPVKNRNDAILNYINASSLEKVADIWVSELKSLEEKFQISKQSSAYDAHFDSLTEFVEKLSAYRSVLKLDAPIKDTESPLLTTILEYTTIISNSGHFDLANKFLSLLSDEIPTVRLEKERISKASGVDAKKVATATGHTRGAGRYGTLPNAQAQSSVPGGAPSGTTSRFGSLSSAGVPVSTPGLPQGSANPYQQQPQVSAPPAFGQQPPVANAFVQPTVPNPYKPVTAAQSFNPYKPNAVSPVATTPSVVPPPPLKNGKKHTTDGWNDLPTAFHKPQTTRATPPAVYQPVVQPQSATQPPVSRVASFHNPPPLAPPPKNVSKKPSPVQEEKPASVSPQVNNRYTPAVSAQQSPLIAGPPPRNGHVLSPPQSNAPLAQAPNPYAPPPQQQQPLNAYAPPPQAQGPPRSFTPLTSNGPSQTPKNPYAPVTQQQGPPQSQYGAPPVSTPLTAAASLQQQQQQQQLYQQPPQYGQAPPQGQYAPHVAHAPPQLAQSGTVAPPPQGPPKVANVVSPVPKSKHPAGDRSHIPVEQLPIYENLDSKFKQIKPLIPEAYSKQSIDTEKRLNILFDHLNNGDLLTEGGLILLRRLSDAIKQGDYQTALGLHVEFATNYGQEGGHWLTGIKRMIQFAEAVES